MRSQPETRFPVEDDDLESDSSRPLLEMQRLIGGLCGDCRTRFTAREAVFSIVLGFKNAPRCLSCLSSRLRRDCDELREQLVAHIHRRDCFLKAWREAERMAPEDSKPTSDVTVNDSPIDPGIVPAIAGEWDAGDMGCGELVMALRLRMNDLPPCAVLQVRATDPAAPEDLPAWCRLSGHTLVSFQHPMYFIRRKGE